MIGLCMFPSASSCGKNRTISKKYICLCWNKLPKNDGTIVENIARSRFNRKKMTVCNKNEGKKAITEYRLLENFILNVNLLKIIGIKLSFNTL